ncbi:TPA: 16S rRNA (cytidine(1402)-2'-O)-methyltransferase, partial [Candidatus Scatousia excrementigallinarum]|nr:16S rRNA (cytidine(1402)-2'-O)-methyltransferase [Candidatus Scatousia excrementigallinarum]
MKEYDFYIVPTPIGNLGDITNRAIEVLRAVDIIACEDMRVTQKLLNHFDIKTKCISYHKFNEKERLKLFLDIINSGKKMALVSDAGTPLFCDPGAILVDELRKNN